MTSFTPGRASKQWSIYRDAADELTRRGVIRYWDDVIDLGSNNPFTYAFETSDAIVVLEYIKIVSYMSPNRAMGHAILEIFENGQVSGGSPSNTSIRNFDEIGPVPFTDGILKGATIDVAGNLIYLRNMIGNDTILFENSFGPFILKAETQYYVTLTDQEVNKNARLKIETSAIRIS